MTAKGGVRPAGRADVDAVAGLWRTLVAHHERLDVAHRTAPGADRGLADAVRAMVASPGSRVFVWDDGSGLAGFSTARFVGAPPELLEGGRGEIPELWVRPDARRRGVGRALVEAACRWLQERGAGRVEVRVHAGNLEGQAFWRALGWGDFVDVLQRRL